MWKGHHATYFKILLKNFIRNGYFVYCSSADNKALRQFIEEEEIGEHCVIIEAELSLFEKIIFRIFKLVDILLVFLKLNKYCQPLTLFSLARTNAALKNINEKNVFVFFPSLDTVLPIVPTWISKYFFPQQWAGINVAPPYNINTTEGKEKKKIRAFRDLAFRLNSCKAFFVIHPIYIPYYRRWLKNKKCHAIPEPIVVDIDYKSTRAQQIRHAAQGRKIIVIIGGLDKRRDFLLFLKTALLLDEKYFFFAIIGQLNKNDFDQKEQKEIQTALQQLKKRKNIFSELNCYIHPETEFNALINVADYVYMHYRNHPYSSNQLLKTIALKKIALINKGFLMEIILKENNWPVAVNNDPLEVALAIMQLASNFEIDSSKHTQFLHAISNDRLEKIILANLFKTASTSAKTSTATKIKGRNYSSLTN